jgi:L-ascorbate metabolism protein UlaG (beta-lactamase superfamily)
MKQINRLVALTAMSLFLLTINGFSFQTDLVIEEEVLVEYIGHASFKISTNEASILLDPFADKVWIGYSFPKGVTADAIFSTHPHYDHDGGIYLKKHPYWEYVIPMHSDPGSYTIGDIKVEGIKGKHSDPYGKEFGQKNTIWIIEVAGLKIAHLGDNGPLFPENIEALQNVDLLMIPIDAEYHILKKEELAQVLSQLNPKVILPMHYKIMELEQSVGKPQDLGPVDLYLVGRTDVAIPKTNMKWFSKSSIETEAKIIVLDHSPLLNNK